MSNVINSQESEPDWKQFGPNIIKIVVGRTPGDSSKEQTPLRIQKLSVDLRSHFPNLTHLYLWGMEGLESLPELPTTLKCLDLRGCKDLKGLPELPARLEMLDLGGCSGLTEVKPGSLPALKWLYLDQCTSLKSFGEFKECLSSLKRLELNGCRFDDLIEPLCGEAKENVVVKVRDHFKAIEEQGAAVLPECKIVVLGNGGVGKTSLVRALKGLPYIDGHTATEGIRLWSWDGGGEPPFPRFSQEKLVLNIWDFGGQDLYHNTHRLFLESRAVFVVVWRQPRRDGKPFRTEKQYEHDPVRPLNYWLDQVYSANPRAKVLLVRTGMDEDAENPPDEWKPQVRPEYRELPAWKVSSKEPVAEQWIALRDALLAEVVKELRGPEAVKMGRGRRAVREELRQWQPPAPDDLSQAKDSERPILRLGEFIEIVRNVYGREGLGDPRDEESMMLLDYLHHCGALYCPPSWRANARLQGALPILVDQRWAMEAIYELFRPDDPRVQRDVRGRLLLRHGSVTLEWLGTRVWNQKVSDGRSRYDAQDQWVFARFMLSCGILVNLGPPGDPPASGEMLLPEFLPDQETWTEFYRSDPLVKETASGTKARKYLIRDRSLGQGFGCLLVGLLPRLFGKVPLFRYGGAGKIRVGRRAVVRDQWEEGLEVLVRLEWHKESNNAYQGDIVVHIFGDERADARVLHFLAGELGTLPGFPKDASFRLVEGPLPEALQLEVSLLQMPSKEEWRGLRSRASDVAERGDATRAVPRLATVGISFAGEDEKNPGIELFPRSLIKALKEVPDAAFDVLDYRSDQERKLVSQLISDLSRSDLMLAFVSPKYLNSKYCMVELLKAAQWLQPEKTFEQPLDWVHKLWLVVLSETSPLLEASTPGAALGSEAPAQEWIRQWIRQAMEYQNDKSSCYRGMKGLWEKAAKEDAYADWMRFAVDGEEGLRDILAAIRQAREPGRMPAPPADRSAPQREAWALEQVRPLAEKIAEFVKKAVDQWRPEEREARIRALCLRRWATGNRDGAVEAFEFWIDAQPESGAIRAAALNPTTKLAQAELQEVREYWLECQIKK